MRFMYGEIYGFGKWVDASFDFTKQSLVSLYGENESGKSTLQQFIMYMLFDLPPSQLQGYKPRKSTKIGGKLTIHDEDIGTYTIDRVGKKVTCLLANGETQDKDWLEARLSGLTRDIYTEIYSFSAIDLASIRKMKKDELSDVLFSVGLTGATNIYTLERQLETKLGELFKARGKIPQINEQLIELENLQAKVQKFKENEATYRFKREEEERLRAELTVCEAKVKHVLQAYQTYEKIEQMVPTITDYYVTERKLLNLPENLHFPEDGVNRFQTLKSQRLPIISEYKFLINNQANLTNEKRELQEKILSSNVRNYGEEITEQKQIALERQHVLQQLSINITKQDQLLKQNLIEIELAEDDLNNISLPFHLEKKWQEIADQDRLLTHTKQQLDESQELINNEKHRLQEDVLELQTTILAESELAELKEKATTYEANRRQADEKNTLHNQFTSWKEKRYKRAHFVLISSISIMVGLLLAYFLLKNYLLLGAGIVIGILGVGQLFTTRQSVGQFAQLTKHPIAITDQTIITADAYKQIKNIIDKQAQLYSALEQVNHELQRVNNEYLQWLDKKSLYQLQYKALDDEIIIARETYSFLISLEPVHWVGFLQLLKKSKAVYDEKLELTNEATLLQTKELELENTLQQFARFISLENQQLTVEAVENVIKKDMNNQQVLTDYVVKIDENKEDIRRLRESIDMFDNEINQLFSYAKVTTEEAFLILAEEVKQFHALQERNRQITDQLSVMFDAEMTEKILKQEVDLKNLAYELELLAEEGQTKQAQEIELRDMLVKVEIEINQMESSDDYSAALFRLQLERDKMNGAAERWAVLKVVETVLMKAKNTYQKKYLGAVMKITASYFNKLTNGKYVNVFAPKGRVGFQVETIHFDKYTVEELSQGTVDQLYIALRLAISKVMSDKYNIPLIVDDAFVHFDTERRGQGVALLQDIAKEQQVLLFTCHYHLAVETNAIHIQKGITI